MGESDTIRLASYEAIREAFYNADLSRALDTRSFEEGNPRHGVLSTLQGDEHRERRRLENPLFRRAALVEYEQELFPDIVAGICADEARGDVDLLELSGMLAVVLAAKRAGIDHDGSRNQLLELWHAGVLLAQAAALSDVVTDRERITREVMELLGRLQEHYVQPAIERRTALRAAGEPLPDDLVSAALVAREQGEVVLDDQLLTREVGLYLHGGSHTSAQTTCNAFHFLLGYDGTNRDHLLERAASSSLAAQQAVHETLRLRPMTPRVKRRAARDTRIGSVDVPAGATVVLDVRAANRDGRLYGDNPEEFDIDRRVEDKVQLWGLSFGAGSHVCIGRSVAGGFPLRGSESGDEIAEAHLYGLVAHMVQAIAARGIERHPEHDPELDERTSRGSRWFRFPVRFPTT